MREYHCFITWIIKQGFSLAYKYCRRFLGNNVIMFSTIKITAVILLLVIHIECDKSPIYPPDIITIEAEYVQARDAWLYISTTSRSTNPEVQLYQDIIQIDRFTLIQQDTIYHVSGLETQTEYSFKTVLKTKDEVEFSSPETRVVTLDTTSAITGWDEYVLGGSIGGLFRDIEAINDDEVWAVGYMNYENGARNGAKWNGSGWDLVEIPVLIWSSDSVFGSSDVYTVNSIDKNNIWFSNGGEFFRYDGSKWGEYHFLFQSLNDPDFGDVRDVTVISHDNIWAAGDNGAVYHYNGMTWQQVNSPTTEDLNTITGHMTSDGYQVWIGGIDRLYYMSDVAEWQAVMDGDPSAMDLTAAEVRVLRQFDQNNLYLAIWGQQGTERYKGYIYRVNPMEPERRILLGTIPHWYNDMVVIKTNDIYLAGVFGNSITHFNGHSFTLSSSTNLDDWFYAIAASENFVFVCGDRNQQALILKGRK